MRYKDNFFRKVEQIWIQSFSSPRPVDVTRLKSPVCLKKSYAYKQPTTLSELVHSSQDDHMQIDKKKKITVIGRD